MSSMEEKMEWCPPERDKPFRFPPGVTYWRTATPFSLSKALKPMTLEEVMNIEPILLVPGSPSDHMVCADQSGPSFTLGDQSGPSVTLGDMECADQSGLDVEGADQSGPSFTLRDQSGPSVTLGDMECADQSGLDVEGADQSGPSFTLRDQSGPSVTLGDVEVVDQSGPSVTLKVVDQSGPSVTLGDVEFVDQSGPSEDVEFVDTEFVDQSHPDYDPDFYNEERLKMIAELEFEDDFRGQTYLPDRFRPDRSQVPSPLKVAKHTDDDLFLQQLNKAQVPWIKQFEGDMDHVDVNVKRAAASILWRNSDFWNFFHKSLEAANALETFNNAVRTAVDLVYRLFPKESLYRIGCKYEKLQQIKQLWNGLTTSVKEKSAFSDACKEIVELVKDQKKYHLMTESDISDLLSEFRYYGPQGCPWYDQSIREKEKGLFEDVEKLVLMETLPTKLEDGEQTQLMIQLLRENSAGEEYNDAQALVAKTNGISTLEEDLIFRFTVCLLNLFDDARNKMRYQLLNIIPHVFCDNFSDVTAPPHVLELIQVAELRRMVLGSRFIGRSHLIWAFYECGYGLPPIIRKTINVNSDEDHPSYHIYLAAMDLANSYGKKCMGLEHFMFAVLYPEGEMNPKQFMNDLQILSENSSSGTCDIQEGILPMNDLQQGLSENLGSGTCDIQEGIPPMNDLQQGLSENLGSGTCDMQEGSLPMNGMPYVDLQQGLSENLGSGTCDMQEGSLPMNDLQQGLSENLGSGTCDVQEIDLPSEKKLKSADLPKVDRKMVKSITYRRRSKH